MMLGYRQLTTSAETCVSILGVSFSKDTDAAINDNMWCDQAKSVWSRSNSEGQNEEENI